MEHGPLTSSINNFVIYLRQHLRTIRSSLHTCLKSADSIVKMNLLYSGVIYTCILAISVQAVVPRHLLMRARMSRTRNPQTSIKSRVDRALALFKPSGVGCCKLGEKTAKKKLSCHIHDPSRKKNMIQRINSAYTSSRLLVGKAEKCGVKYGKPFEKCCNYREDFYRDMHRCKINFSDRDDRRKCKTLVRDKYT